MFCILIYLFTSFCNKGLDSPAPLEINKNCNRSFAQIFCDSFCVKSNYGKAGLKFTYGSMQCAAVNTCVEDIKLAPQYWPELVLEGLNKAANQGHSFLSASCPLTIFKIVGTFRRICGSWQPERICCSCNLYQKYKIQIDLIEAKAWYFISIIFPHVLTSLEFPPFPFAEI